MKRIGIVGAGISGTLKALVFSRLRCPDGGKMFQVELLEAADRPYPGASLFMPHCHLGEQYILDAKSATVRVPNSSLLKICSPDYAFTDKKTRCAITEQTRESGRFTANHYDWYNATIRPEYEQVCQSVASLLNVPLEVAEGLLFGSSKEGEFCRSLTPRELEPYHSSKMGRITDGTLTPAVGLNISEMQAAIMQALESADNVKIRYKYSIKSIKTDRENKKYLLTTHRKDSAVIENLDGVVLAAGAGSHAIEGLPTRPALKAYRRAMVRLDISRISPELQETIYLMLETKGAIFSCYNNNKAVAAMQDFSYLPGDQIITSEQPYLDQRWRRKVNTKARREFALECLQDRFEFLGELEPENVESIHGAYSFNTAEGDISERVYMPVSEPMPGCFADYLMKGSDVMRSTIECVEMALARLAQPNMDLQTAPSISEIYQLVVPGLTDPDYHYNLKNLAAVDATPHKLRIGFMGAAEWQNLEADFIANQIFNGIGLREKASDFNNVPPELKRRLERGLESRGIDMI